MSIWLQFITCAAVIFFCGTRLSKYGDVIAEKTGMGQTWIGVVLMASVTSLPELITGISAVTIYNLPNIAAGDALGSCMFNLVILAGLDIGKRRAPISSLAQQGQVLTGAFGILLLGITNISIVSARSIPAWGWVGSNSVVSLLVYLVAMRVLFKYEKKRVAEFLQEQKENTAYAEISGSAAYLRFAIYAVIILAAGAYLPHVADEIAIVSGVGRTFIGSILVALSTSLPEIAVTRAALNAGSVDLAVGNILGSNLFNIGILAIDDVFYLRGPLLRHVSANNLLTASAAMAMTALITIALMYRSQKKFFFISWDSLGIFLIYAVVTMMLYLER